MKKQTPSHPAFFSRRVPISCALCAAGALVTTLAFTLSSGSTAQAQAPKQEQAAGKMTPQEEQKLADGLKPLLNKSTEGLVPVQRPDGSSQIHLDGRFLNVTVAKIDSDGSVSQACVDNAESAAAFFGIDPKLINPASKDEPQQPNDR